MSEPNLTESDILKLLQGVDFTAELAERERAHRAEVQSILMDFLQVLDALDRAIPREVATGTLAVVRKQLLAAFEHANVHFMDSLGQPFDPSRHHALEMHPGSGDNPIVVEEVTRGCEWNGEILRPAGVVLGRPN